MHYVGSFVEMHRIYSCDCRALAQLLRGMWDSLDQGSNPCLLHRQEDSLPLSHQGRPRTLETHMDTSCFMEEKTQLLYSMDL